MKTYESAHRAAVAYAGGQRRRVENWLRYTDRLIRRREIVPQTNGNGQVKCWLIVEPNDWLVVAEIGDPGSYAKVAGPFATKRAALASQGVMHGSKISAGRYKVKKGVEVVMVALAAELGVTL